MWKHWQGGELGPWQCLAHGLSVAFLGLIPQSHGALSFAVESCRDQISLWQLAPFRSLYKGANRD